MNVTIEQVLLLYNIHSNNLSPVDKLINERELEEVLSNFAFNGSTYSLPYLFFIDSDKVQEVNSTVKLYYNDVLVSVVMVESCYCIDIVRICSSIFGTTDRSHAGVDKFLNNADKVCISGHVTYFNYDILVALNIPYLSSSETKKVVFQSRNPPHKAHEQIIGSFAPDLLYTTPYSTAKSNDYPFNLKMKAYEEIRRRYGVSVLVTTLPRVFAGPREALQNCLIFQNLGATKFIMGRGKNCVGDYYGDSESYEFCRKFYDEGLLKIEPIWVDTMFNEGEEIKASVIKSEYIDNGIEPPGELMSNYISSILLENR
jgi:sulfate adenylyltransferase